MTPFMSAQSTANMLGDNAFLLEQLGFGHSTLAQTSACTIGVVANYFGNSEVGVFSHSLHAGCASMLTEFANISFQRDAVFSAQLMIPMFSFPSWTETPPFPGARISCVGGGDSILSDRSNLLKDSPLMTYGPWDT